MGFYYYDPQNGTNAVKEGIAIWRMPHNSLNFVERASMAEMVEAYERAVKELGENIWKKDVFEFAARHIPKKKFCTPEMIQATIGMIYMRCEKLHVDGKEIPDERIDVFALWNAIRRRIEYEYRLTLIKT